MIPADRREGRTTRRTIVTSFYGLTFDQGIPRHSTFSKNRHGQFQQSNLFQRTVKGR